MVDPSLRGCNSSKSQFPSAVLPEGRVDNTPGPDDSADANDDDVDVDRTVPMPRTPHRTVFHNTTQGLPRGRMDPTGVLPEDNTFTLPSGHFGSGLGGPALPIATPRRDEQGANAHAAHMAGPAGAHLRASLPPTPPRPVTRPPQITPPPYTPLPSAADPTVDRPSSPCTGGTLLSPRENQERTKGVNRFDIEGLAYRPYHGKTHGVDPLTMGFLANCGFNMVSSDDVVGSLNEIVTVHRRISDTWTHPSNNTSGPQVDRILLKSFKLFPSLKSLATEDVVGFYDRFQELSTSHLLALMPFDSIVLKYRYEGLFIPGLGTRRYVECGRAMMDFLPRLIPGTLSTRVDATLAAVRSESNNGYDYLWRILELYVPGFDPIIPIHPPQWADSNDVFHFAQAYLLFFRLQGKMLYHYTDCTRSGIFLRAIMHSDYADTVTLLQSHVNSYREEYDTGFLPPHLRVHGLAESIHQNAQSRMRDIASPRIRRIDVGPSPIQGPPHPPMVYRYERQDRQGATGNRGRDQECRAVNWGEDQRDTVRPRQHRAPVPDRPRQRRGPPRPDRNRRPYLADVQCAACKRVGHVAKHCDMLATAICLERYMKHDLTTTSRDSIEKDWLTRWTERLGNPDRTPRQVMRTYVEDLDITVAHLDDEMDWDCWDFDAFEDVEVADI